MYFHLNLIQCLQYFLNYHWQVLLRSMLSNFQVWDESLSILQILVSSFNPLALFNILHIISIFKWVELCLMVKILSILAYDTHREHILFCCWIVYLISVHWVLFVCHWYWVDWILIYYCLFLSRWYINY